jgi:hypothetical protein
MTKNTFLLFVACLLLSGCAFPSPYTQYDIGADYEVLQSSTNGTHILPKMDAFNASQLIPPVVTEVAWNDSYILAKQLELQPDPLNPDAQTPNQQNARYWIIDLKYNKRFGPYTKKQFEAQKKEFRISSSLQLQKVEKLAQK